MNDLPHDPDIADRNVERLLHTAYHPEAPAPDLLPRVQQQMCDAAREHAVLPLPGDERLQRVRRRLGAVMAAAAVLAAVALTWHAVRSWSGNDAAPDVARNERIKEILAAAVEKAGLTPKPRGAVKPAEKVAVKDSIQTRAGERRRVALPDGSILYVNQNTTVSLDADRSLRLTSGEVFLEVAPRDAKTGPAFVVKTAQREVKALGTKFAVRADDAGRAGVVVTQGKVRVSDVAEPLVAGYQLDPDRKETAPAARTSHLLDWTRELMAAAETPLVPDSKFSGGALVAVDPYGQEAKLSLRKYHVDVHIEDGFARTIIDQTYFNHNAWRMECTFYFPLPADASLSRLAMYVGENLMEGGMAERDHARNVYEEIRWTQSDPALLEWVDGSTFKMRVFPLEGRQEKRIIIGYTQRVSSLYGRATYRFPAGHSLNLVDEWKFHARIKNADGLVCSCDSHKLKDSADDHDLLLDTTERKTRIDRDVVIELRDPRGSSLSQDVVRFSGATSDGHRYLMLRYRPQFAVQRQRQGRDWVFLFESSGDRDPLVARVQVDVIRALLANAEHDDTFTILAAGTRVHTFSPTLQPVTPETIKAAVEFLESRHLIGALDLGQALSAAAPFLEAGTGRNPHLVHVGTGVAAMGERRIDQLSLRVPPGARYVGVGVGKRWSRDFMKAAAERTGGYFTQINPDEPVTWRAFELAATLNTPRLMHVAVTGNGSPARFLTFGTTLAEGEELCAVARVEPGEPVPQSVTVQGSLNGQEFRQEIPVPATVLEAGQVARAWAKLEIERLLADTTKNHRQEIIDLSKAMYVMSPYTSLLVLENEEMYQRFKVDRGRKDHWAPYPAPAKIPVVYEPEDGQYVDARFAPKTEKPHANQILETILLRLPPTLIVWPNRNQPLRGHMLTTALQVYRGAFALPGMTAPPPGFGGGQDTYLDRNLTNDEIGNDPDLPTNYNLDRLEDISVPGPVTINGVSRILMLGGKDSKRAQSNALEALAAATTPAINGRYPHFEKQNGVFLPGGFRGRSGATRQRLLREGGGNNDRGLWFAPPANRPAADFDMELGELALGDVQERLEEFRRSKPDSNRGWAEWAMMSGKGKKELAWLESELAEAVAGQRQGPPFYGRPSFSMEERVFYDLVSYAPGMNTSPADIEAVKEAEAAPGLSSLPGHIDAGARKLIEQSRTGGWRTVTVGKGDHAFAITFDGTGRYAYERRVAFGLREQVVCDGTTLLHLYPELGIGAKRTLSRFHRMTLAEQLPWLLPPAEDLARGADLRLLADGRTAAVVPRGADEARDDAGKPVPYLRVHLVFADGKLAERHIVEMPTDKVLYRETYDSVTGDIRLLNAEGKELSKRTLKLGAGMEPSLRPDTDRLVVLPLPYRTQQHVYSKLGIDRGWLHDWRTSWTFEYLDADKALELFAAEFGHGDYGSARLIFKRCFASHGDRRLGFFTLLASGNVQVSGDDDFLKTQNANPHDPLAAFLALHLNPRYRALQQDWGLSLGHGVGAEGTFLHRLSAFHDLFLRWRNGNANRGSFAACQAEQDRAFAFVRRNKGSLLGWAMLSMLQDRADDAPFHRAVAAAWKDLGSGEMSYIARYEHARGLLRAGDKTAAELFRTLYRDTLKEGLLPPIDGDFRWALQRDGEELGWSALVRETADQLLKDRHRPAVVTLAWQCWHLGDAPLAENLLADALRDPADDTERLEVSVAALEFLMGTNQFAQADALLQPLLEHKEFAKRPLLWRVGSAIADRREQTARAIACLEKALDLEYQDLPKVISLQQVRQDYGRLLGHYQWLASAVTVMKIDPPADLLPRTIRAADRWRALDRDGNQACESAARVLKVLGAGDLAWDYLTTPIGLKPNEAGPWQSLAAGLGQQGDLALADRAWKAAFEAEPTDAQLLWNRAENLKRAGKVAEAHALLRKIVNESWQPRFNWLKAQARWQLEGR